MIGVIPSNSSVYTSWHGRKSEPRGLLIGLYILALDYTYMSNSSVLGSSNLLLQRRIMWQGGKNGLVGGKSSSDEMFLQEAVFYIRV